MEPPLTEEHRKLYTKLYASGSDIAFARACGEHIRKKGWFRAPWARGKVYFQQSVYVTSLIVSYGRPFVPGKRDAIKLPADIVPLDNERTLHDDLITRRNKIYAHSDIDQWTVRPVRLDDFATDIVGQPALTIKPPDIDLFLTMTGRLKTLIDERMTGILGAY